MRPEVALEGPWHLSGEKLDLLLIDGLAPSDANAAKSHLDECEMCRTRWRELYEDKRRFQEQVFARTLPKVEAEVARSGVFPLPWWERLTPRVPLVLAVAVAALALAIGFKAWVAPSPPSLEVYLEHGTLDPAQGGVAWDAAQATVRPGDLLRVVVDPGRAAYLLVADRDEAGSITVLFPAGGRASAKLERRGRLELARPIELDGPAGRHTLVGIFSSRAVDLSSLSGPLEKSDAVSGSTVIARTVVKAP